MGSPQGEVTPKVPPPYPRKENMKPLFRGSVKHNRLVMGQDYIDCLFALEGQDIDLTIEKHRNNRSTRQNKYFYGVIVKMLSDELGYTKDEMADIVKGKFLSEEIKVGNDIIRYTKSSTLLNTLDFESLMTDIREWASAELNIFLPLPNQIEY